MIFLAQLGIDTHECVVIKQLNKEAFRKWALNSSGVICNGVAKIRFIEEIDSFYDHCYFIKETHIICITTIPKNMTATVRRLDTLTNFIRNGIDYGINLNLVIGIIEPVNRAIVFECENIAKAAINIFQRKQKITKII